MKSIRSIIVCGLLPLALLAGSVHAQGIGRSGTYTMPPNWGMMMDKLTPEQRTQAIGIQEKMMQMEMDYQDTMAQMEMKHAHEMMQMQAQLLDLFKGH
ncbi:hypothetical protein [Paraburkholderia phenazinium]|jgi:hypothetical protein|uniref:Uncharacterized protein n=1 Tax=Paraburkholderia phenazinium TaxID=60549 RepID=A0A1G7Q8V5_9BURK|nr:hypothetical protein [Paraburkholderia phenazinium]SDF94923.1 hypothetical protein SAMN05216466_101661 [Paraburkholderia phenazinium]